MPSPRQTARARERFQKTRPPQKEAADFVADGLIGATKFGWKLSRVGGRFGAKVAARVAGRAFQLASQSKAARVLVEPAQPLAPVWKIGLLLEVARRMLGL